MKIGDILASGDTADAERSNVRRNLQRAMSVRCEELCGNAHREIVGALSSIDDLQKAGQISVGLPPPPTEDAATRRLAVGARSINGLWEIQVTGAVQVQIENDELISQRGPLTITVIRYDTSSYNSQASTFPSLGKGGATDADYEVESEEFKSAVEEVASKRNSRS